MIEEGVIENLNTEEMWKYMGELMTNDEEVHKLQETPIERLQEKLGIRLPKEVEVRVDYRALTAEEKEILSNFVSADMNGDLSNDFLNTASNRLVILVAVAAVAAAWLVLYLIGPD